MPAGSQPGQWSDRRVSMAAPLLGTELTTFMSCQRGAQGGEFTTSVGATNLRPQVQIRPCCTDSIFNLTIDNLLIPSDRSG